MRWGSLRNRLAVESIESTHECVIVLSLEDELRHFIETERLRFGTEQTVRVQLDPHITVLYCGFQASEQLRQVEELARTFEQVEVDFVLGDVGVFSNRSGFTTNLHYKVNSEEVHSLHRDVHDAYLAFGLKLQTPYTLVRYEPHISVFDRVILPKNAAAMITPATPDKVYRAGGCHLVGEPK